MSNYYSKREAKVNIAMELSNRGWKIYGFKNDESDAMTDYYSPANWDGIATKNGYVLVVDNKYNGNSGKDITKWTGKGALSAADQNKINKLLEMTQENGATEGEENNAKELIKKIEAKRTGDGWEVIGKYPEYQVNSKGSIWHVEKDGALIDRGNSLTIFADIPDTYRFDINTMEYKESYKYYTAWENGEYVRKENKLSEEEEKAIKAFKTFILRVERAANGMNSMGDGTAETEKQGQEQQENEKLIKVTEKVTKKVLKMTEVERKEIKVGDYLTFSHHGHYWKVTSEYMQKATWKGVQESRKAFVYEIVGSASRGYQALKNPKSYYDFEFRMLKSLEEGKIKIFELKEVEEVQEVEKWVKAPQTKKATVKTNKVEKSENEKEVNNSSAAAQEITVKLNEEKQGIEIYFTEKPSEEVRTELKDHGFRWSKYNNCWYAKQSNDSINFANSFVKNETVTDEQEQQTEKENNSNVEENIYEPEFKNGYVYNVHFKEWNMSIDEIQKELRNILLVHEVKFNKVILTGLSYDQILKVKELSDKNGSILFKDEEIQENQYSLVNGIIDTSVSLIEKYSLNDTNYSSNEDYKKGLLNYCKEINITKSVLQDITKYIAESSNYIGLVEVLNGFLALEDYNSCNDSVTAPVNEIQEELKEVAAEQENKKDNEEIDNVINFDDILNKFDDIEIKNDTRLSNEDFQKMEELQSNYDKIIAYVTAEEQRIIDMENLIGFGNDGDFSKNGLLATLYSKLCNVGYNFINKVIYYYKEKYSVNLENNFDKYDRHDRDITTYTIERNKHVERVNFYKSINYNTILDDIFNQLNGYTFKERYDQEIKDKVKNLLYNYNREKPTVKLQGSKIKDNSFYRVDERWGFSIDYRYRDDFKVLFEGLQYFDCNSDIKTSLDELYNKINAQKPEVIDTHYISGNKVKSIKLYKNGSIDIEFVNSQIALEFSKNYCKMSAAS